MKRLVYADNAATTRMSRRAIDAMTSFLSEEYANPSQPYSFARTSKKALLESRQVIADCIGAYPEEIYFTSCGTESDNWVIHEATQRKFDIVTSSIEHHAILHPCACAEATGLKVTYLPVDSKGLVDVYELDKSIVHTRTLVSIMMANNEIGTVQPIKELCKIAHSKGAIFHTDAVQAIGHIPVNVHDLGVDLLSASAHKFNGPKGIGFLYVKNGLNISPFIYGGGQEKGLRSGTENVASIVGMATALKENVENADKNTNHLRLLENDLIDSLKSANLDFIRNGTNHIPGNISISFKGADGEMLLHRLDLMGISVSTGSACDSQNTQISHVLKAISLDSSYAKGTIRISLGINNSEEDVFYIASALKKIISG